MKTSLVNDVALLQEIKLLQRIDRDSGPVWAGAGMPATDVKQYSHAALWARIHWLMYEGFLDLMDVDGDVLDVGSRSGHAGATIAMLTGRRVVCVDKSARCVAFGKRWNLEAEHVAGDFFGRWPGSVDRYQYVFALEVLEHIPARQHHDFVIRCLDRIPKGGRLFLTTPNEPDSRDHSSGHRGYLSKGRADKFLRTFSSHIETLSYYDCRDRERGPVVVETSKGYRAAAAETTHFRMVLTP